MKNLLLTVFLAVLLLMTENVSGSKMMGTDLTWTCVGKDSFIIKLVVYRDCNGTSMGAASIPIKCATSGAAITTLSISCPSPLDLTPTCGSSCTRCQSLSCSFPYGIEQYTYTQLVVLSSAGSCCKISLSYSMCCRNQTITTGAASANFFTEASLDRCLSPCDNSPTFTSPPVAIMCVGQDFQLNQGIIDVDLDSNGNQIDSISFGWTSPKSAAGTSIAYTGSYTYQKPVYFWGFPNDKLPFPRGFQLDPSTGDISFRPMKVEQTVMAIKVEEWRNVNGKMTRIGEVRRDIQIIVISCPNNHAPVLSGPFYKEVCAGDSLAFSIATNDYDPNDSLIISWDNKIKGATWSDDNGKSIHPTGTLKWLPDSSKVSSIPYVFNVTVHDDACPIYGKSIRAYQILVKPGLSKTPAQFSVVDTGCGLFYFYVINPVGSISYHWNGLTPNGKLISHGFPSLYAFKNAGKYPFSLSGYNNGCVVYYASDTLEVKKSNLLVELPADTIVIPGDTVQITPVFSNIIGKIKYKWYNGDTASNPLILNNLLKDVAVSILAEDSLKCPTSDDMFIDVKVLTVDIGKDQYNCPGQYVSFNTKVEYGVKTTSVSYSWFKVGSAGSISSNYYISVQNPGIYVCIVTDNNGDKAYDTASLTNYTLPKISAGLDVTVCSESGLYKLIGSPASPFNYWSGKAVIRNGSDYYFNALDSTLTDGGIYKMAFTYTDSNSCKQYDDKNIELYFTPIKPIAGIDFQTCMSPVPIQLKPIPYNGKWSGKGIFDYEYFKPSLVGEGKHMLVYEVKNKVCLNFDTLYVTVLDSIDPVINTFNKKKEYCIGFGNVELKNYPIFGGYWTGPPNTIVNKKYFNTNQKPGVYILTFEVRDSMNCPYYKNLELTVVETSIAIDKKDLIICENENLHLFADAKNTSSLKWTKGSLTDGTFLGSDINSTISFKPGVNDLTNKKFWLFATTTDTECVNKQDSALVLISAVKSDFEYSPTTLTAVPVNVSFTDLSTTNNANTNNWNWDFGNGQTSILQNPVIKFDTFGKYQIHLKVKNSENCSDSLTNELNIVNSIEDEISSSLFIIPNPASEQVLIKSAGSNIEFVRLINGMGQIVKSEQNIDNEQFLLINNKGLKGIYLLQTGMQNGKVVHSKIMFE